LARRYVPAAIIERRTLAIAGGWAALAGIGAGAAAHAVSRLLFPVHLVLPAAIGIAVGGALAWTVRRLRLSRLRPAVALAAGAVVLAMLMQLVLDYRAARAEHERQLDRMQEARVAAGLVSRDELPAEREEWMAGWSLWRFARAHIGLDDTGVFTGTPPVFGRGGALALSAVELLLALLIASLWAGRTAVEPACPSCGAWRIERHLGSAAHGVSRPLVRRLLAGDPAGAARLMRPPDTREEVRLSAFTCPAGHDGEGGVLRIGEVFWTRGRRLALRRVADLEVGGEELAWMAGSVAEVEVEEGR
jgi:hypothetical protein